MALQSFPFDFYSLELQSLMCLDVCARLYWFNHLGINYHLEFQCLLIHTPYTSVLCFRSSCHQPTHVFSREPLLLHSFQLCFEIFHHAITLSNKVLELAWFTIASSKVILSNVEQSEGRFETNLRRQLQFLFPFHYVLFLCILQHSLPSGQAPPFQIAHSFESVAPG